MTEKIEPELTFNNTSNYASKLFSTETIEDEVSVTTVQKNELLTDQERLDNLEVLNALKIYYNNNTTEHLNVLQKAMKNFHPLILLTKPTVEDTSPSLKVNTLQENNFFYVFTQEKHVNLMLQRRFANKENMDGELIVKFSTSELQKMFQKLENVTKKASNLVVDWEYLNFSINPSLMSYLYEENDTKKTPQKSEQKNEDQTVIVKDKKKRFGLF